jgi:outer membrane biosynthesis protein TonB
MIASLVLAAALIGDPAATTSVCAAHEPQLQVIRRPIPANYPIDDPTGKQPVGVVVLEIEVGEHGNAAKISAVCDTAGARAVRAAKHAVGAWQFGAPAHTVGQIEVRFTVAEL